VSHLYVSAKEVSLLTACGSAILGLLICVQPLSMELMDWRGTGGPGVGSAGIGIYLFFGGLLMLLGSVGEWILGNTFPFVIFGSFSKSAPISLKYTKVADSPSL
jgi:succinate-acetate transporter protein